MIKIYNIAVLRLAQSSDKRRFFDMYAANALMASPVTEVVKQAEAIFQTEFEYFREELLKGAFPKVRDEVGEVLGEMGEEIYGASVISGIKRSARGCNIMKGATVFFDVCKMLGINLDQYIKESLGKRMFNKYKKLSVEEVWLGFNHTSVSELIQDVVRVTVDIIVGKGIYWKRLEKSSSSELVRIFERLLDAGGCYPPNYGGKIYVVIAKALDDLVKGSFTAFDHLLDIVHNSGPLMEDIVGFNPKTEAWLNKETLDKRAGANWDTLRGLGSGDIRRLIDEHRRYERAAPGAVTISMKQLKLSRSIVHV